ncbi:RibD family protein [Aquidulcibacter paucihalophilus]|uniref:RibD family protein n=1 Tax=Aquidulcibacter paucihalophilus TaxID=1978549 RepID=UPI0012FF799E|nr:RibD family protein [Aquidulcibacter paucihalophilus]
MTIKSAIDRPKITLKLATSLDARIATVTGQSQWITGPESRAEVHRMRARHGAVLTGIGTVLADDPELTARLDPPAPQQPLRVVLDSAAHLPLDSKLVRTSDQAAVIWCTSTSLPDQPLDGKPGVYHHQISRNRAGKTGLDLEAVLRMLRQTYNVKTVMVETGPTLATAFVRAGLVDQIAWFRAPILLGGDGRPVFESLEVEALSQALELHPKEPQKFGRDVLDYFDLSSTEKA